eukprot:8970211-Karenia_brevis.AAC.1
MIKLHPTTLAFQNIQNNGRVQLIGVVLPGDVVLVVVNIYGWTNGHTCTQASQRTDDMFDVIFQELRSLPDGPKIILGDLNADPVDIPILNEQLDKGNFLDIGAHTSLNGGVVSSTCYPPNHIQPTRRDYIFASANFVPFI